MQRSGQTAKTQSSAKAPGRRALSPAPSWEGRSALPRGQPAGGRLGKPGALGRRGQSLRPPPAAASRGSDRRRHRSAQRYATLPRDLAGNFGVFLGQGRASSITHTAPAPAAARGRRDPQDGREGARLRKAGPAGAAGERGLRSAATRASKLRRRPSCVPGGQSVPARAGAAARLSGAVGGREVGNRSPAAVFLPATPAAPASAPRSACGSPAPRPRPAPTRTTRRRRCCCTGTWP